MGHRANVENLMLELLTNPERPIAQRMGAAQFFLSRVGQELRLFSIKPEELVDQAQMILDENVEDTASKSDVTKFWGLVVRLIDQATEHIPPFPEKVPTLDDVLAAINNVWDHIFSEEDFDASKIETITVNPREAFIPLRDVEVRLKQHRQFYGEYL